MKRLVSVFLLMVLMNAPAYAEDIDLFDLSYNEKLALYEELSDYFDKTFTLKPGMYKVGKDIKPGTYRFMYDEGCGFFTRVRIGDEVNISQTDLVYDRQKFDLYDPYSNSYYFQLTEAYFRLKEEDYLIIELCDVRMTPMEKELFW